jgi:hypothetical protein
VIAVVGVPAVFPDGRLPGPRWRWLTWPAAAAAACLFLGNVLSPASNEDRLAHWDSPFGLPVGYGNAAGVLLAVVAVASRRRELARSKAIRAVRELDAAGATVTFEPVARAAGVSRSWLCTQPGIRAPRSCGCATSAGHPAHRCRPPPQQRRLPAPPARGRHCPPPGTSPCPAHAGPGGDQRNRPGPARPAYRDLIAADRPATPSPPWPAGGASPSPNRFAAYCRAAYGVLPGDTRTALADTPTEASVRSGHIVQDRPTER